MVRIAALLALVAAGCTDSTAMVLRVDGDLEPGMDLDALEVSMTSLGAQVWEREEEVRVGEPFARSYRIARTSDEHDAVRLEVSALLGGRVRLGVVREAAFTAGRETTVRVCLWARCLDGGGEGEACRSGECVPPGGGDGDGDSDGDAETAADAEGDGDGEPSICEDSCPLAFDGLCDDGGPDADRRLCALGTDCGDCGPRATSACVPSCADRECGDDGCGGACPPGCGDGETCAPGGGCVRWVEVAGTTFQMGARPGTPSAPIGEEQHEVTLSNDFVIASREVGAGWFRVLTGLDIDPWGCEADCPAAALSWHGAAAFTVALSLLEGLEPCYECYWDGSAFTCLDSTLLPSIYECGGYRLPTEAEWELAARGGTTTGTYNGDITWAEPGCEAPHGVLDPIAWFCGNSDDALHPRAGKAPNAFGLYDVLGNAEEHVHDWYGPYPTELAIDPVGERATDERVSRGGSYSSEALYIRASSRGTAEPGARYRSLGLRPARTLR